jgi:hypothetical protein
MKKSFINLMLIAALSCGAGAVQAQIILPAASPAASVTQKVGLTDVSVEYSRPALKKREVGREVATYGQLWRTGANSSTKLKFSDAVTIQGKKVPAGEYTLLTIPGKDEWTVIINKNLELSGNDDKNYKQADDVARFMIKPTQNPSEIENFTINFANLKNNAADLEILWDNTIASFTIETEVDSKVMAQIQEQVVNGKEVTPALYTAAATYYFESGKDMKQAFEWIKKANETTPRFWTLHTQAKIQGKMKDYKGAVQTAEKSMALAKEANNVEYVRMNEQLIAEWKKMK